MSWGLPAFASTPWFAPFSPRTTRPRPCRRHRACPASHPLRTPLSVAGALSRACVHPRGTADPTCMLESGRSAWNHSRERRGPEGWGGEEGRGAHVRTHTPKLRQVRQQPAAGPHARPRPAALCLRDHSRGACEACARARVRARVRARACVRACVCVRAPTTAGCVRDATLAPPAPPGGAE